MATHADARPARVTEQHRTRYVVAEHADELAARQLTDAPAEKALPPLAGALIKNEQDVQLLERLMFLHRRQGR